MVVNIDYDRVKGHTLKIVINDKEQIAYMRLRTVLSNIQSAIYDYDNTKEVIAYQLCGLDFETDMQRLKEMFYAPPNKPILYEIDFRDYPLGSITVPVLASYCNQIPPYVRLVIKVPNEYADMGTVTAISQKYPNTAFCGGYLLRLPTANIGCLRVSDFKGLILTPKPVVKGCGCVMSSTDADSVELIFNSILNDNKSEMTIRREEEKQNEIQLSKGISLAELGFNDINF